MNLYLVVSEVLKAECRLDDGLAIPESYQIAELVVARNHGQARWYAWKNDKLSYTHDIRDMPKFECRLKIKDTDLDGPAIVSDKVFPDWVWDLKSNCQPTEGI